MDFITSYVETIDLTSTRSQTQYPTSPIGAVFSENTYLTQQQGVRNTAKGSSIMVHTN